MEHATERFGRYELVEMLCQGGMAEVWKAKIRGSIGGFERTVVVKRILPQLAREEEFVAMFMREAQLCSMLSHANIVQVHELGELEGEFYIAMEYVNGRDLQAILNSRPREPLPAGCACVIARDMCRALSYAYHVVDERGTPLHLIHRDVTPSNVMLSVDGAVKLLDFGVAKALSSASAMQTSIGNIRGKLGYSAPERLLGGQVDHRTDLFAVGVLVHELLTGRRLFQGDDLQETIDRVLTGPIYAPSELNPAVPPALDAIVLRAVERDPVLRFQSGADMADAFEPYVHQLAWGPAKITQLLSSRFPQLDPAALTNEFAEDDANTTVSPPRDVEAMQRTMAGPTATFVRSIHDMGSWTNTQPNAVAPHFASRTIVTAPPVALPGSSSQPEGPVSLRPSKASRAGEATTSPSRPLRSLVPATSLAGLHSGSTALPRPPRTRRSRAPLLLAGGALALVAGATAYFVAAMHPAPVKAPTIVRPAAPIQPTPPPLPPPVVEPPPPAEAPVTAPVPTPPHAKHHASHPKGAAALDSLEPPPGEPKKR